MCNLYSLTKGQQAIREMTRAMRDATGNLPLFPGVFPDYAAPIVRNAPDGEGELWTARWGMPSPIFPMKGTARGAFRTSAEFGGWIIARMHAIAAFLITSILGWLVWSGLDGVLRAGII